jgi:dihydrofolate reductase
MRKIIVSEFVSLDGVMQAPGGAEEDTEGGFAYGGWTGPYWHDDIGVNLLQEINRSDALLLGRKTWQTHAEAFEPTPAGDPFADVLNNMRKYVVSTTLKSAEAWRNSTIISENVADEVRSSRLSLAKISMWMEAACWFIRWHRPIWWMNIICLFFPSSSGAANGSFQMDFTLV